jgi:hypothetical protein
MTEDTYLAWLGARRTRATGGHVPAGILRATLIERPSRDGGDQLLWHSTDVIVSDQTRIVARNDRHKSA